jgi:acyl carrier protein
MDSTELARNILRVNLQLGDRADSLTNESMIMGSIPEFNSLTVIGIISAIEEHVGCEILDTEITAEIFETLGSLANFIQQKMD